MAEFAVVKSFNTANLPRTLSDKPAAVTAADTRSSRDSGRPEKVEGKTGDVGLDEIHWGALINRYTTEYAAHDAAAMRHVDGLTAEQVEEQRKSAESRMAWMKAANAKKLFQMVCWPELPHRRWLRWRKYVSLTYKFLPALVGRRETNCAERRGSR